MCDARESPEDRGLGQKLETLSIETEVLGADASVRLSVFAVRHVGVVKDHVYTLTRPGAIVTVVI